MSIIDRKIAQANFAVASSPSSVTTNTGTEPENKTEALATQTTEADEKAAVTTEDTKNTGEATQGEGNDGAPSDAEESEDNDDDSNQGLSPEEAKEKRKQKWSNRVSKWKSEIQAERARAEKAERALAELNTKSVTEKKEEVPVVSTKADDKEPDPNDVKYIGKYTEYLRDVARYDRAEEQRKDRWQKEHDKRISTFDTRREEFKKTAKDFDTVTAAADSTHIAKLSPMFMFEMTNSDTGPQEMYALSKDKALLSKLGTLSEAQQLLELGMLRASLKQPVVRKEVKINSTPPITELGGTGVATQKSLADIKGNEFANYKKMRQAGKK